MPAGRPTKYNPAYCDEIIDFMSDGYSVTAFAGSIRVSRSTVYLWAEEHTEFSDALQIAQAIAGKWWEDRLRDVAEKNEGNATAAIFGLKNRAAEDWRDKRDLDHTSSDKSMTPQQIDLSKAPPELLQWIVDQNDKADEDRDG